MLSTPADIALAAVEHLNGPEVWAALLTELAAELQQVETGTGRADSEASAELDDVGVPWVPRLGGRAPLSAELEQVARTGRRDRTRHPGGRPSKPKSGSGLVSCLLVAEDPLDDFGVLG